MFPTYIFTPKKTPFSKMLNSDLLFHVNPIAHAPVKCRRRSLRISTPGFQILFFVLILAPSLNRNLV